MEFLELKTIVIEDKSVIILMTVTTAEKKWRKISRKTKTKGNLAALPKGTEMTLDGIFTMMKITQ